jgi:serine/threonine-protein kinase
MMLSAGARLGPYEILAPLGEGAMGIVYKANDTRLGRPVAIKFVKSEFTQRWEREARAIAALNHPHIATLYDVGEYEGARYLAMEYVRGAPLKGPLPVKEVVEYGIQIASALAAAHAAGIVHRDLKPGNILVAEPGDGAPAGVKVLDFGLAKPSETGVEGATAPTETAAIAGTPGFIAPEQLDGKPADARSDIFAFGCILYELASGRRAFPGGTMAAALAATALSEPKPIEGIPAGLALLIQRCLRKDPLRRQQHMADAKIALEDLRDAPPAASTPGSVWTGAALQGNARTAPRSRVLLALAAVLGALAGGLGMLGWLRYSSPTPPEQVVRFSIPLPAGMQMASAGRPLALSPDSTKLACALRTQNGRQLYLRSLDSAEFTPIGGTDGGDDPAFSPDGNSVAYLASGKLKVTPLAGGLTVSAADAAPDGVTWLADGRLAFVPPDRKGLKAVGAQGGDPAPLASAPSGDVQTFLAYPEALPGGVGILSTNILGFSFAKRNVTLLSRGSTAWKLLVEDGEFPAYVSTGHLVFERDQALMALPLDSSRLKAAGPAAAIVGGVGAFAVSRSGTLAYTSRLEASGTARLVWVDRKGNASEVGGSRAFPEADWPMLSPDGRSIAFSAASGARLQELWVWDLQRDVLARVAPESRSHFSVWTPDGKRIVTSSEAENTGSNLFWMPSDGSGQMERLTSSQFHQDPASWSPDGKWFVFDQVPQARGEIWLLTMGPPRQVRPLFQSQGDYRDPAISPDGRWLAYASAESGRFEVYVQPFPEGGRRWQVSADGGREPLWSHNGRELFYRQGKSMMAAPIAGGSDFQPGRVQKLFEGDYASSGGYGRPNYDVTADGSRFLMVRREAPQATAPAEIHVILNWAKELKRLSSPSR